MSIDLENSKRKAAKASKFPEDVVLGMPNVESVRYELPESTFKLILIQMMI